MPQSHAGISNMLCFVWLFSLIVDYLRHRGHVHTASIFLPEAHMTHKLLSRDDIARVGLQNSLLYM